MHETHNPLIHKPIRKLTMLRKLTKALAWTSMTLSLVLTLYIGYLGATYQVSGHGLSPLAVVLSCTFVLFLGWLSACVADQL